MTLEIRSQVEQDLIEKKLIPLDKSWIIRMGVLDLLNGRRADTIQFLEEQEQLSDDLEALHRAALVWDSDLPVDVGESATLYRFLQFTSWKNGLNKQFVLRGSLRNRPICHDPNIINYSQDELHKLDNGTSQWTSAAVLTGDTNRVTKPSFKQKVTYEAVSHWYQQRAKGQMWLPRCDQTIMNQAVAFINLLAGRELDFTPEQAEDYCFARAFGIMTKEEGEARWSNLRGHESNRLEEMEIMIEKAQQGLETDSKDHRVIQAIAMKLMIEGKQAKVNDVSIANKSWPQFWRFLTYVGSLPASLDEVDG